MGDSAAAYGEADIGIEIGGPATACGYQQSNQSVLNLIFKCCVTSACEINLSRALN